MEIWNHLKKFRLSTLLLVKKLFIFIIPIVGNPFALFKRYNQTRRSLSFSSKHNIGWKNAWASNGSKGVGTKVETVDIVQLLNFRKLDYTSSYNVSRELVQLSQNENKDLEYFIDIHRDSLRKENTTIEINRTKYANLLFVVGTGHAEFEKNLQFANNLHTLLENRYPSLSKDILQKSSSQGNGIYNQDFSPNSLIIEIGGVDNTVEELHRSTEALAEVLSDYYWEENLESR